MERCLTSRGSWLEGDFLGVFHPGLDLEDLVEEQEEQEEGVLDGEEAGGVTPECPGGSTGTERSLSRPSLAAFVPITAVPRQGEYFVMKWNVDQPKNRCFEY